MITHPLQIGDIWGLIGRMWGLAPVVYDTKPRVSPLQGESLYLHQSQGCRGFWDSG